MEAQRHDAIVRRPDEESARESFPEGFPQPIDVPARRYTDPEFLALEQEHVLGRCWLFVAHADQVLAPGDYLFLDALDRMGHPIFLVRGLDGVVRCTYWTHFLSPVPRMDETAAFVDGNIAANWSILLEDLANQAAAQKSMQCGALEVLRLQYQERRIRYVHEEIDRRIGPERVPRHLRVPALLDAYVEEA